MTLVVPDHIAFCREQGRTTLLDIQKDRYFALPADLEAPFGRIAAGDEAVAPDELLRLRKLGVVTEGARQPRLSAPPPSASHVEDAPYDRLSTAALFEVGRDLFAARRRLRRAPFGDLAAELAARPQRSLDVDQELRRATDQFLSARPLVPIEPVCLQDSLALLAFLARRGLHPNLVFGVALDPFHAHCWVQVADVVLNDALLRARAHTPILVV